MDIKKFQEKASAIVKKLDAKQRSYHGADLTLMHLVEEFGEIAHELYNAKSGRDSINKENLGQEIADVMILLVHLSHLKQIDVDKAIKKKLSILEERYKQ